MLTLTEVVTRRAKENPIEPQTEAVITAFFRNTFIKLVPVDFIIATRARRVIWDFPWLTARDAIHIATAVELRIPTLEHYDDDDMGKVAERIKKDNLQGFPDMRHPHWVGQTEMNLPPSGQPGAPGAAPSGGGSRMPHTTAGSTPAPPSAASRKPSASWSEST